MIAYKKQLTTSTIFILEIIVLEQGHEESFGSATVRDRISTDLIKPSHIKGLELIWR